MTPLAAVGHAAGCALAAVVLWVAAVATYPTYALRRLP